MSESGVGARLIGAAKEARQIAKGLRSLGKETDEE